MNTNVDSLLEMNASLEEIEALDRDSSLEAIVQMMLRFGLSLEDVAAAHSRRVAGDGSED